MDIGKCLKFRAPNCNFFQNRTSKELPTLPDNSLGESAEISQFSSKISRISGSKRSLSACDRHTVSQLFSLHLIKGQNKFRKFIVIRAFSSILVQHFFKDLYLARHPNNKLWE